MYFLMFFYSCLFVWAKHLRFMTCFVTSADREVKEFVH